MSAAKKHTFAHHSSRFYLLAVLLDDENIAIPFDCSDYYGRASRYFSSEDPPSDKHQARIAAADYQLLLSDPGTLVDYKNRMHHSGSGTWVKFGICHGVPYLDAE